MSNFKTDIEKSAASIMDIPVDLQGLVKQVNGITEVEPPAEDVPKIRKKRQRQKSGAESNQHVANEDMQVPDGDALWKDFVSACDEESSDPKSIGHNGNAGWCRIDKDLLSVFKQCPVNGHSITDMVNAALRQFILHYKSQFQQLKKPDKLFI